MSEQETQFQEGDRIQVTRAYAGADPKLAHWTGMTGTVLIPSKFWTNVVLMDEPPHDALDGGGRFWDHELELIPQTEEKPS